MHPSAMRLPAGYPVPARAPLLRARALRPLLALLLAAGCARGNGEAAEQASIDAAPASSAPGQPGPPAAADAAPGSATTVEVTEADLRLRLSVFAHDSMQGRAAGSEGHRRALRYIVAELTRLGLTPAGDSGSFYQRVPIVGDRGDTTWSANVVAVLGGSDARLRSKYVALGAHSDHVGMERRALNHDSVRAVNRAIWARRGRTAGAPGLPFEERRAITRDSTVWRRGGPVRRDSIYNGADDDGSGSMALLELAEWMGAEGSPPRRSVLFVWHTGEEIGLNGSDWFVQHPTVPLADIIAQINIDMIGRGTAKDLAGGGEDYLSVIGPRRLSRALDALVREVNAAQSRPLELDYALDADGHPENIYCRSDHAMYASRGIPVVFFFTNLHEDYHEVTDEPQYIDYPHYRRITTYIGALVRRLRDGDAAPVVDGRTPDPRAPCRQ